jgi:hypothetical protein
MTLDEENKEMTPERIQEIHEYLDEYSKGFPIAKKRVLDSFIPEIIKRFNIEESRILYEKDSNSFKEEDSNSFKINVEIMLGSATKGEIIRLEKDNRTKIKIDMCKYDIKYKKEGYVCDFEYTKVFEGDFQKIKVNDIQLDFDVLEHILRDKTSLYNY